MQGRTPPSGNVTFLFTDIEGSTWLVQHLGGDYDGVLHEHNRLLREAWAAHGGYEVSTEGDAFFVTFDEPSKALGAALDAQRSLTSHEWPEGSEVRVRMGIHTGECRVYGHDYVGLAVHQAARIASAAHGGQVILSDATREAIGAPTESVSFVDLGAHRLKDLAQAVRLFQLAHPELGVDFPPPRTLTALPNNFPIQLTTFVGREDDIDGVSEALAASRLVTLTGAGGAGKTRLALQVGAELIDDFPDGAWLVDLAPLANASLVPGAIADALGVRDQPGRPIIETLAEHLLTRNLLIVLDNCEHLIQASAEVVHRLLSSCPDVKVLATSREALNVPGEVAWRLRSLVVPESEGDVVSFARTECVRLFVQRARAARPDFELDDSNADAVVQICRRLDGLPLALELAAARVRVLGPGEIAARLDDRFRLLAGGSRTALPRQRTLEAAVAWSYELLSDEERSVFDRLSVFAGGCKLEAAEEVCGGDALEVADAVVRLAEKSLVTSEMIASGSTRYRMLETLRQFGRERLTERGESASVRDLHLAWAVAFVEGPRELDGLAPIDAHEWENVRTALDWAFETDDVESALRILTGARFAHFDEHAEWFDRLLPRAGDVPRELYGRALYSAGGLDFMVGRWASGVERNRACASVREELGDVVGTLWCRVYEGVCLAGLGREDEGRRLLRDVLSAARTVDDKGPYARALLALAWSEADADLARAEELTIEGEAVTNALGSTFDKAHAREATGYVRSLQRRFQEAGKAIVEALHLYDEGRIINCGAHCLETAAAWAAMTDADELGAELWGAADRIRRRTGDVPRPWERRVHERWLPQLKVRLDDAVFDAAYARGLGIGWRDAIALAEKRLLER